MALPHSVDTAKRMRLHLASLTCSTLSQRRLAHVLGLHHFESHRKQNHGNSGIANLASSAQWICGVLILSLLSLSLSLSSDLPQGGLPESNQGTGNACGSIALSEPWLPSVTPLLCSGICCRLQVWGPVHVIHEVMRVITGLLSAGPLGEGEMPVIVKRFSSRFPALIWEVRATCREQRRGALRTFAPLLHVTLLAPYYMSVACTIAARIITKKRFTKKIFWSNYFCNNYKRIT